MVSYADKIIVNEEGVMVKDGTPDLSWCRRTALGDLKNVACTPMKP